MASQSSSEGLFGKCSVHLLIGLALLSSVSVAVILSFTQVACAYGLEAWFYLAMKGVVLTCVIALISMLCVRLPPEKLGVVKVRLPKEKIETRDGVTYFCIEVVQGNDVSCTVMRRYSNFLALSHVLDHVTSISHIPFPRKHFFFGCEGERLEARRSCLEHWLNRIIKHAPPPSSDQMRTDIWLNNLRLFLDTRGNSGIKKAAQASATPPAPSKELSLGPDGRKQYEVVRKKADIGLPILLSWILGLQ